MYSCHCTSEGIFLTVTLSLCLPRTLVERTPPWDSGQVGVIGQWQHASGQLSSSSPKALHTFFFLSIGPLCRGLHTLSLHPHPRPPHLFPSVDASVGSSIRDYLELTHKAVAAKALEDPKGKILMDGSGSIFTLDWSGSGVGVRDAASVKHSRTTAIKCCTCNAVLPSEMKLQSYQAHSAGIPP